MNRMFIFLMLFIKTFIIYGQGDFDLNSHQLLNKADIYLFNEQPNEALKIYNQLLQKDTSNSYLKYQIALCYSFLPKSKDKEIYYFSRALNIDKPLPIKETYIYKGYASQLDLDKDSLTKIRRPSIKPFKFTVKDMYDNICVSENNEHMVFVNTTASQNRIFYLKRIGDVWTQPEDITSQLLSMGDCFPSFISKDGKRLYLTKYDNFDSEIYVSTFDGIRWSSMKKLNTVINSSYWDAHACETPDGMVLYFASNRPGGFGGMDIYYSIKVNGDFRKATNVGSRVNTPLDEDYPLIVDNGRTLIFTSQGFKKGRDKTEMYYASFVADFIWSEASPLGYPFNTPDDDFYYVPLHESSRSFFYRQFLNPRKYRPSTSYTLILKTEIKVDANDAKYIGIKRVVASNLNDENDVISIEAPAKEKYLRLEIKEGIYSIELKGQGLDSRKFTLVVPAVPTTDTMIIRATLKPSEGSSTDENIWKPLGN